MGFTCHHLFGTDGMTVKETELHSLAGPTPQESKCGSELWKQWAEFKPSHVFLRSVSGNGNGSKIKGERRRGGGVGGG